MAASSLKPIVRERREHNVSRGNIDPDALKVIQRLNRMGDVAYLVGGGVRDLLLEREPKDFDVATSAHPRRIKKLFRNSFLVGRRFRLAHIRFGDKVIETSTFRRQPEHPDGTGSEADLYHHRDNTFGTPAEDALRRDFTINGLFYDARTTSVIDYVGGLADLKRKVVRCIGDPNIRFREDPVRMLRAVRFAARLGFRIEAKTQRAILRHHAEILKASPPRLFEEILRLFTYGSGEAAFRLMRRLRMLGDLFPQIDQYLARKRYRDRPYWRCLAALDSRKEEASSELRFAVLFYPLLEQEAVAAAREERSFSYEESAREMLTALCTRLNMPKCVFFRAMHILDSQRRFRNPPRRFSKTRFMSHETFPDSLALFDIVTQARDEDPAEVRHWRDLYRKRARSRQEPEGSDRRRPRSGRRRRGGRGRQRAQPSADRSTDAGSS